MKRTKIPLIAAMLAMICTAGNAMFATVYYIHSSPGVAVCSTVWTGNVCPTGNVRQCSVIIGDDMYWVCKRVDGGGCQLHFRN